MEQTSGHDNLKVCLPPEADAANSTLQSALIYARNGWPVFPVYETIGADCACGNPECGNTGKHPRIQGGLTNATTDADQVLVWWSRWPNANIGMRLDDSVCVLDVDPKNAGVASLTALQQEYYPLDERARARTGSGGWHYLFDPGEQKVGTHDGFRPGLDLRSGAGAYIIVAPSRHKSGKRYEWAEGPTPLTHHRKNIPLYQAPEWLLGTARSKRKPASKKSKSNGFVLPDEIGAGQRDITLTRIAGKMRRAGLSPDEILAALRPMNTERCKPPLDDGDLKRIASSIGRKDPAPADEDAGLTKNLATAITAGAHFARDSGSLLYIWQDGVYRPNGERFIQKQVKMLTNDWEMSKSWSPELGSRVHEYILVDAPDLWEQPPLDVLNCRNGILDVGTRTLRPHSPDHLSPVQVGVNFDPAATCPYIDRFIRDVFPDDAQHLPHEVAAWLMLPDTSIQKAVLCLGEGANGKSVWLNLLLTFLGQDNVSTISLHRLEADKFSVARLVGKLCNIGTDLPTAALTGTSMFKALTGGDIITAERKFEASFEFRPFVRLLFSANSAPRSDDATHGFFRRWLCIPFTRTFDDTDPNTVPRAVLDARLSQPGELSGMLNRALDALPTVRKGRFTESASVREALEEFRKTTDPLAVWLDQNTVERPDGLVTKDQLRRDYGQVCHDNGRPIMGDVQFTGALKRLRPRVEATKRRVNGRPTPVFLGLGMVTRDPDPSGLF